MAETGIAATYHGTNVPFDLREYPVPDPGPGAAVLALTMANVCGSDLHYWRGDIDVVKMGRPTPMALGHEGTGKIHKLGDGVTTDTLGAPLSEGDRVVFQYFYPCMQCPTCLKGHTYACPTRQFDRTAECGRMAALSGHVCGVLLPAPPSTRCSRCRTCSRTWRLRGLTARCRR